MTEQHIVRFRFYEELNDFLPSKYRKRSFAYVFKPHQTVKDAVEALGVPHTEVDLIIADGISVGFDYRLRRNDYISVYPVFETLDITNLVRLRPKPLRRTKFIADVHLGKLSRYLRLLGFDTFYQNDMDDDEIIQIAAKQKRIILTRDTGLLKNGRVTHGYRIRSQIPEAQIREVIERFQLHNLIKPFHRCTVCNGLIIKTEKKEIEHLLEPNTKRHFQDFYRCNQCQRIYWEGSHFDRMNDFIEKLTGKRNRSRTGISGRD